MTSETDALGATTKYAYDALGRRIATDGAKEDTTYTYDEVGNLVSQTTTGAYDLALEYAYDKSGRMTKERRTENGATLESSYLYDAIGQLTSFTRSDGISESYIYDPVGNMTAKTKNGVKTAMRYNAANQLTQSITGTDKTTYTYDANGNLVKSENAGGVRSYAYNALGLLAKFTREDGYTEDYTYNANRLLSGVTNKDGTMALTYDILYGDGVVISENRSGEQTNYTYGLERISAQTGKTRTEYVYDGRGSVAAEVSYNNAWYTFGGGLAKKTTASKSYSPFGEQIGEATSGFGYNGEYYNAATGLIYLRARFYAPEMNRFSQKDSFLIALNEYEYCLNNPISFADHNGLEAIVVSGGIYKEGVNIDPTSYNFISTAIRELRGLKQSNPDENITWLIADVGWTPSDIENFKAVARDIGISPPILLESAEQFAAYVNTSDESLIGTTEVNSARTSDLISSISFFSHGIDRDDRDRIALGYTYQNDDLNFDIDADIVEQLARAAFVEAPVQKIFACNIATRKQDSIGVKIATWTGSTVYTYSGTSSYKNVVDDRSFFAKALDWPFYAIGAGAVSQRGREIDALWAGNADYGFAWQGTKNQPKASIEALTWKISPSAQMQIVAKIPDVVSPRKTLVNVGKSVVDKVVTSARNAYNSVVSAGKQVGNFFSNLFKKK